MARWAVHVVVHACTGWMVATRMAGTVAVGEERRGFEFVELARLLEAASAGRHSSEITIGQPVTLDMNIGV